MDSFIVVTSLVDEFVSRFLAGVLSDGSLSVLRILRVFRCIRALRALIFLRNNLTLRMVVSTFLNSMSPISITLTLEFVLVMIIANLGQSLFSGQLWSCSDIWVESEEKCLGIGSSGLERRWSRNTLHFDWIGNAFLSVFAMATNEGWASLMNAAADSGHASGAIVQDSNALAPGYFALGILGANLIVLNMFRGVFITVFMRCARQIDLSEAALRPPRKPWRVDLPKIWDWPAAQQSMLFWTSELMGCP